MKTKYLILAGLLAIGGGRQMMARENSAPVDAMQSADAQDEDQVAEGPKYRPLVEEYTGLWCGSCPSGYVAIEELHEQYGDDFVYVTYHVNDLLSPTMTLPSMPSFVPAIATNRNKPQGASTIYTEYPRLLEDNKAIADLKIDINWADSGKRMLKADLGVTFVKDISDIKYDVEMILVADGLSDQTWVQSNFYAGLPGYSGKYWDIFTKGGAILYGLEYNGVAISSTVSKGLNGALPSKVVAGEKYNLSAQFDMSDGASARGVQLIRDKEALRVVALVKEKLSGKVVNSISSCLTSQIKDETTSVDAIGSEAEVVEEVMYDIQGRRRNAIPFGEPYILMRRYSDGSVETLKLIGK